MKISTKTFVVTGAGSGIGQQLAIQLIQKGANVAGVDMNQDSLSQTQQLAGSNRFKGFCFDITDATRVQAFPQQVIDHFGQVDGLINNAGIIQPFKPVNDLSADEIMRVMQVNFFGTLNLTRAFLPTFLKRPEAHIANVSSMGGFLAVPGQTVYGAAKAGVKLLTEGLYAELVGTNVYVTVIFPGAIATNISENSGLNKPNGSGTSRLKPLASSRAAQLMLEGIEKNKFRLVIGSDARLLDFLYRLNPRYATELIQKKLKTLRGQR